MDVDTDAATIRQPAWCSNSGQLSQEHSHAGSRYQHVQSLTSQRAVSSLQATDKYALDGTDHCDTKTDEWCRPVQIPETCWHPHMDTFHHHQVVDNPYRDCAGRLSPFLKSPFDHASTFTDSSNQSSSTDDLAECLSDCIEILRPRTYSMLASQSDEFRDAVPQSIDCITPWNLQEPLDLYDDVDFTNWGLDLFQTQPAEYTAQREHHQTYLRDIGSGESSRIFFSSDVETRPIPSVPIAKISRVCSASPTDSDHIIPQQMHPQLQHTLSPSSKKARAVNKVPLCSTHARHAASITPNSHASLFVHPKREKSKLYNSSFATPHNKLLHSTVPQVCKIQIVTKLNKIYWKNGRKNLQCFPACPEHTDFYSMRINNRKHSSVGVCRGPIYCQIFAKTKKPSLATHKLNARSALMSSSSLRSPTRKRAQSPNDVNYSQASDSKYQYPRQEKPTAFSGVNTGGTLQELVILGRFERVPQQELLRSGQRCMELLPLPPPQSYLTFSALEEFRQSCFQAVEMEDRRENIPMNDTADENMLMTKSIWFFLPDVWKVEPILKKKRKATRSAPAQTFPFCFRIYVYARMPPKTADGLGKPLAYPADEPVCYECIGSTYSDFFELFSTRTVDRVKQKVWNALPNFASTAMETSYSESSEDRRYSTADARCTPTAM